MGMLFKPPHKQKLIVGHKLAPDVFACLFNNDGAPTDLVKGRIGAVTQGTPASIVDSLGTPGKPWNGKAWNHNTTSDKTVFSSATVEGDFLPVDSCTVVIAQRKTDATNRASVAFGHNTASGVDGCRCQAHLPYSDGIVYWDFGGTTAGTSRISASSLSFGDDLWVFTVGSQGMEIWQNGIRRASQAGHAVRTRTDTTSGWLGWGVGTKGSGTLPGAVSSDLVNFKLLYVYNRQLSAQEVLQISADPLAPFQVIPYKQRFYYLTGAVAGGGAQPAIINNPVVF